MFRSSSKLPWLSGNTRRHFPVREATKDKQLDGQIPHIPSISKHTHNMLDMCKYNMASQHDSTTQVFYSIGSEERDITNMSLMTQHSEHTSQSTCGSLTCLGTDIYKWKRLRSRTIYQILPRAQDRSWGNKLNVEVHVELLARLTSLCKNIK